MVIYLAQSRAHSCQRQDFFFDGCKNRNVVSLRLPGHQCEDQRELFLHPIHLDEGVNWPLFLNGSLTT